MTSPSANWRDRRGPGGQAGPGEAQVEVDRLALRISDEDGARSLGRLVALGLADSLTVAPGQGRIDQLRLQLPAEPGESTEDLARRIVDRLTAAISQPWGDQA
jgi:hypothetical protein